jgi:hypothetical protein
MSLCTYNLMAEIFWTQANACSCNSECLISSNLKLKDCFTSETLANANAEITENEAKGKIHIL